MNAKHNGHRHKGDPFDETRVLEFIQGAIADKPGVMPLARGFSHAGEHAAAWLALGVVGMIADEKRRTQWGILTGAAFGSHAASVILKRIVHRPRPHGPRVRIGVKTPSKLSFPSSHATSTTAAMIELSRITGSRVPLTVIPLMMLSRMTVGVHYPTDVAAGALLGGISAEAIHRAVTHQ